MLQVPSTPQNQLLDQYDDMIQFYHGGKEKTGTWTRSRFVSCVSMVHNNAAQAALYIGKHKVKAGNHICGI